MATNNLYKKWESVLDSLFNGEKVKESLKNFFAEYAEHHARIEIDMATVMENNSVETTLPLSLQILFRLNLEGLELSILDKDYETSKISIAIETQDILEVRQNVNIDIIPMIEHAIMEEAIIKLNKILEGKSKFGIYMIINKTPELTQAEKYTKFEIKTLLKIT